MPTPRFLGSRFLFWLLAPWLVLGCAAFGLVAQDAFDTAHPARGAFATYFAALCVAGLFAMTSRKYGLLCGRVIAATIALAYLWYFADTYFIEGQPLQPTGRKSDSTPFNAICGFLVIGLPCILFAVTGRPFWGKRQGEEPNKSPVLRSTTEKLELTKEQQIAEREHYLAESEALMLERQKLLLARKRHVSSENKDA